MKRLLPLFLMALLVGACGSTPPSESPATASPSPSTTANQTFDPNFANWNLAGNLPAGLAASGTGSEAINTWAVIDRASVIEKVEYDEWMEYLWPSSYCLTDQQIAHYNEIAVKYEGEGVPAADPWLGCAAASIGDPEGDYGTEQVALAIYQAGGTRLNVLGKAVPATCAATPAGTTMTTTIYGETGEGPEPVVSKEIEVPLSPFEATLFGLPAYGYSVRIQTDLFDATRYIELCAQKGDRILVLMTTASPDVEAPFGDDGQELPLPAADLRTVYGAVVWPALANGAPALVAE